LCGSEGREEGGEEAEEGLRRRAAREATCGAADHSLPTTRVGMDMFESMEEDTDNSNDLSDWE
jgi:hypothetical protein